MNPKTRTYVVIVQDARLEWLAQTPGMAVRSVAQLHPQLAGSIVGVVEAGTANPPTPIIGICAACGEFIMDDRQSRPLQGPRGLECGECRPNARLGLENARKGK